MHNFSAKIDSVAAIKKNIFDDHTLPPYGDNIQNQKILNA